MILMFIGGPGGNGTHTERGNKLYEQTDQEPIKRSTISIKFLFFFVLFWSSIDFNLKIACFRFFLFLIWRFFYICLAILWTLIRNWLWPPGNFWDPKQKIRIGMPKEQKVKAMNLNGTTNVRLRYFDDFGRGFLAMWWNFWVCGSKEKHFIGIIAFFLWTYDFEWCFLMFCLVQTVLQTESCWMVFILWITFRYWHFLLVMNKWRRWDIVVVLRKWLIITIEKSS